jgi:hypothetical protein
VTSHKPDQEEIFHIQRKYMVEINGLLSDEMASNLIRVKVDPGRRLGCKGWGEEVEDAMVRFGWQRENGLGAALLLCL